MPQLKLLRVGRQVGLAVPGQRRPPPQFPTNPCDQRHTPYIHNPTVHPSSSQGCSHNCTLCSQRGGGGFHVQVTQDSSAYNGFVSEHGSIPLHAHSSTSANRPASLLIVLQYPSQCNPGIPSPAHHIPCCKLAKWSSQVSWPVSELSCCLPP